MTSSPMTTIAVLLKLLAYANGRIKEVPAGSNAGELVESVQRWAGGEKGQAWCSFFVYWVGTLTCAVSGATWPLPRTGSCEALRQFAITNGMLHDVPAPGDVYLLLNDKGLAHHTGFVIAVQATAFTEVSGNTSDPTAPPSREGYGVFQHQRALGKQYKYISWIHAPSFLKAPA